MNKILNLPAWLLFLVLMFTMFIGSFDSSLSIIFELALILWIFIMGMSSNQLAPSQLRFSNPFFIFRLFFVLIYLLIFPLSTHHEIPTNIVPIQVIATLFVFSCLWTCAKIIVIAETKNVHGFDRYIGTFFLLWFFPIGIWFVQPRLNRLAKKQKIT
jgi:hypothetical protein